MGEQHRKSAAADSGEPRLGPSATLLIAAGLAWAIACLWFPLTDTDIWWHLAAAKLMCARKALLRVDPFCLSSLGTPWIDLHWGFQCMAYAAWKLGGPAALVAGKCLAAIAAFGLALKPHLDRRTVAWLIPLAAFGCYQVRFFIDARPLALTLLGLGLQYVAVIAHLRGGMRRSGWLLIPVQIAMVNVQGLYPLGNVLVTCLIAGEWLDRRRMAGAGSVTGISISTGLAAPRVPLRGLLLICAGMWAASLANPYGWTGLGLPLALLGRITPGSGNIFSAEIAENLPLLDLLRLHPGQALPFLFLGLAVAFTFDKTRSRVSTGHALLFLAFAGLGCMAQRNLPLALLAGLMAAGRNLQVSLSWVRAPSAPSSPSLRHAPAPRYAPYAGWGALAAVVLLYGPKLRAAWEYELPGSLETPFRFPAPAVAYLEAHPLPGNIFNELRYGGYLEFRMYPDKLAFVDGRMILRSPGFYRDFLAAVDAPDGFPAYRARYGITHALLPISEDQRYLPLAAHLLGREGWALLYCDGASALLADTAAAAGAPVLPVGTSIHARFGANPRLLAIALANADKFLRTAGRDAAADSLRR